MIEPISKTWLAISLGAALGGAIRAIKVKLDNHTIEWKWVFMEGCSAALGGIIFGAILSKFLTDSVDHLLLFGIAGIGGWAGNAGLAVIFQVIQKAIRANLDTTITAVKSTETHTTEVKTTEVNK